MAGPAPAGAGRAACMASWTLALLWPPLAGVLRAAAPPPDFLLLEYPKCGRTWLTAMLQSALGSQGLRLHWVNSHGEDIHGHPFLATAAEIDERFAAASASVSSPFSRANRTLLLLRDPLDVLVSSFYERKYRGGGLNALGQDGYQLSPDASLEDFALRPEAPGGLASYVAFLNNWVPAALAEPERVHLVHFEAMARCPLHVLGRVANGFLGLNASCTALRAAVEEGRFERLQRAGSESWDPWQAPHDASNPQSAKYRRGRAHAAHEDLSPAAFEASRRALDALKPAVRAVFYESARECYVLGSEGRAASAAPAEAPRTHDLVCGWG